MSRSAPGCAPATRPRASGSACAGVRRTSSSPRLKSLYILLGSASGRAMLATHAHGDRRRNPRHGAEQARRASGAVAGAAGRPVRRQAGAHRPVGDAEPDRGRSRICWAAPPTSRRARSSIPAISARANWCWKCPHSPLEAVMSAEVWQQVYDRLARLIEAHRTTLVFVNTRRMAERVARQLSERLGEQAVTAHHGSMAKEQRLSAEQRLKRGELKALVATASLELGIDIGDVDLVCQLGLTALDRQLPATRRAVRPRGRRHAQGTPVPAVARRSGGMRRAARQRAPRRTRSAEHSESAAGRAGAADRRRGRAQEWPEAELYDRLRRAWPYRALSRDDFDAVVRMLAEGFTTRRGRRGALIHHDAVNHMLRGRRGARLTALTSGGDDPGQRRLPGAAGAREPDHRHRQRGLRRRKPGRRRVPARQHRLSHHAGRTRRRAGGGRAGPAADHPVLAGRGAGTQRRTVRIGVAPARRHRHTAAARCLRRQRAPLADRGDRHRRSGGRAVAGVSDGVVRRAGMPADPGHHRAGTLLRRGGRHAACRSTRRSAAGSTAPGASRCASASAANSTSNSRRRRPRTISCCR